jgi:hypothetical protein
VQTLNSGSDCQHLCRFVAVVAKLKAKRTLIDRNHYPSSTINPQGQEIAREPALSNDVNSRSVPELASIVASIFPPILLITHLPRYASMDLISKLTINTCDAAFDFFPAGGLIPLESFKASFISS